MVLLRVFLILIYHVESSTSDCKLLTYHILIPEVLPLIPLSPSCSYPKLKSKLVSVNADCGLQTTDRV